MEQIWEKLYKEAMNVINPHEISSTMWVGSVASAVLTKKGSVYTGICIDTNSSLGMCSERNALSTMLTHGENEVDKSCFCL
ncbi:cytidine deaminase [Clostridium beijerinckii]|nr:cytidine deaminase [Clostridium beijerinckii]